MIENQEKNSSKWNSFLAFYESKIKDINISLKYESKFLKFNFNINNFYNCTILNAFELPEKVNLFGLCSFKNCM